MIEGDLTLLVAGMLAHESLLGFGYGTATLAAMSGAVSSDLIAFACGRHVRTSVGDSAFYKKFSPRLEWLEQRFGILSILLVKWIYGLRTASSVLWGVSRMGAGRFTFLTVLSCGVWVLLLTGLGYLFGSAISAFFDRFESVTITLCVAAVGILGLMFVHHTWLSPKLQAEAEKAGYTHDLDLQETPISGGSELSIPVQASVSRTSCEFRDNEDGPESNVTCKMEPPVSKAS